MIEDNAISYYNWSKGLNMKPCVVVTSIDYEFKLLQAVFFMTYVLTSGWTGLASELMQPFVLLCHWLDRFVFGGKNVVSYGLITFPYHTEIPRVLLFGLLGFTASVTAPLMLPFLMVYFILAYLVYRNQVSKF